MQDAHETRATVKRKLPILWIVISAIVVLLGLFLFQLLGPNPQIIVSKETTYITEPLGDDGLPDYEAYLLKNGSAGLTPENNAAVLLWEAMWPGDLPQEHWLPLCSALGMKQVPSRERALDEPYNESVRQQVAKDLARYFSENAPEKSKSEDYSSPEWQVRLSESWIADEVIGEASRYPWTSEQWPALAVWVKENNEPLDLIVEASNSPKFFSPSPTFFNNSNDLLFNALLVDIEMMRTAQESLHVRAMWHLGEGRNWDAWQDLLACHRLARIASKNNTLIGQLVGIAIDGVASQGTVITLHHAKYSKQQLTEIMRELLQLEPTSNCSYALNNGERLSYLDAALALSQRDPAALDYLGDFVEDVVGNMSLARIDWNVVLRDGNHWFDRMVRIAKIQDRAKRSVEFDLFYSDLSQLTSSINTPSTLFGTLLSHQSRSRTVSMALLGTFLPALEAAFRAEDRANTQLELTRLAAALAVYRAEEGEYPEALEQLVPAVIPKLPVDLYSGKSFLYERKDDGGYLLYSVFENEIDDRGTGMDGLVINGEWVDEQPEDFDYQESDLVIRVPVPPFKYPEPPSKADLEYGYGGE